MKSRWIKTGFVATLMAGSILPVFAATTFITGTTVSPAADGIDIVVELACNAEYISHTPTRGGDRLRIQLDVTTVCRGISPTIIKSRGLHRPVNADIAKLLEIDYDGNAGVGQILTLSFSEDVRFDVIERGMANTVKLRVYVSGESVNEVSETPQQEPRRGGTLVRRPAEVTANYVINLSSSQRPHAESERPVEEAFSGLSVFETEVILAGGTWYRLRVGSFKSTAEAEVVLAQVRARYPTAWIDRATSPDEVGQQTNNAISEVDISATSASALAAVGLDRIDELMADGRQAMVAGELSRAVQIYTKVIRTSDHDRHAQAQEYLALAREKNGQKAHAKAEYQRYLAMYPDSDGATRVSQRLAALLANDRQVAAMAGSSGQALSTRNSKRDENDWRVQTFFSQYYRRDANQLNEEDEIVSQSALYSDINLDVRRRGERFDFSSRLSAGYRSEFLDEDMGSGDQLRVSYAYADLADSRTGLRGRIGRQSRNTGGVLGRFDGVNLNYPISDRVFVNGVAGLPVNSSSDMLNDERVFYGASVNYGPVIDGLDLGLFVIQQQVEGIQDRQAVGAEMRYFGQNKSLWGLIDYDTSYNEMSSAFLQGNWRFASRLTLHGSFDRRHAPFLSTSTAMIGQPVETFAELLVLLSEEEIRQLSLDRSPLASSYTVGLSHSLTPRLQLAFDGNQTEIEAAPESGGVAATAASTYQYFSASLTASSLIKEGDVSMVTVRQSESDSTSVMSLTFDMRFPIGRSWRVNPRLRADRREMNSGGSEEFIYSPGIRIQYRRSQKFRLQFEAGKQFSQRETTTGDLDRESYFINVGYQAFF